MNTNELEYVDLVVECHTCLHLSYAHTRAETISCLCRCV